MVKPRWLPRLHNSARSWSASSGYRRATATWLRSSASSSAPCRSGNSGGVCNCAGAMLMSTWQGMAGVGFAPDAHELSISVAAIAARSLGMGVDVPLQGVELLGALGLRGQAL
ncbi:hypothetical protein G6F24_016739 [Rhizopus arrhizus]|nr:hypothetical protein G6F24_016739 [Rhizopus arrhizus]